MYNFVMSKRSADELIVSPLSGQTAKRMDQKSSPNKEEDDQRMETKIKDIKDSAPKWFVDAFSLLLNKFDMLESKYDSAEAVKANMKIEIRQLEERVSELEAEKVQKDKSLENLKLDIIRLESYTRRDNLLIDGIPESPNEDIKTKVLSFFRDTLKLKNANSIQITRVHRLGTPNFITPHSSPRPRTVIVRFHFYPDRDAVWRASWELKNKHHFVSEDYPEEVKQNRRILLPCLKAAKRDPKVKRCTLKADRLIVDGTSYTAADIDKLPGHLQWRLKGEKYDAKSNSTFFFGKDSYLSNFHSSPFKDGGVQYNCSEQYYLQKKCLYFNDEEKANSIMRSSEPSKMKALSHQIKKLDEAKWKPLAKKTMERACFLKFSQNQILKEKLLASRGTLVECNRRDNLF